MNSNNLQSKLKAKEIPCPAAWVFSNWNISIPPVGGLEQTVSKEHCYGDVQAYISNWNAFTYIIHTGKVIEVNPHMSDKKLGSNVCLYYIVIIFHNLNKS